MTVLTKSIFDPAKEEDGYRILITRYYPRGISKNRFDEWVSVLSPSPKLLFDYKEGKVTWNEFTDRLLSELRDEITVQEALTALNELSNKTVLTLLCFERSGTPCHRHIIRELIDRPEILEGAFESKDAYYHEGSAMQCHIADQ